MIKLRNEKERYEQVKPILTKLSELRININDENVRTFYKKMNEYVKNGETTIIKVDLPVINAKIIGVLETNIKKETVVKLEYNK
jgi:hypothetical protein